MAVAIGKALDGRAMAVALLCAVMVTAVLVMEGSIVTEFGTEHEYPDGAPVQVNVMAPV